MASPPPWDWRRPSHLCALGFGTGLSPWAPGTMGSVLGTVIYVGLLAPLPMIFAALVAVVGFALGVRICGQAARDFGARDHQAIVWDEVVGVWLALLPAGRSWPWVASGFVLFRLLDITKPWPIGWADRKLHGGLGIMLDDALAGLITAGALAIAQIIV